MKLRLVHFELEQYGDFEGMVHPKHPHLKGYSSFSLSVENCRMTEIKVLFDAISQRLKTENALYEECAEQGSTHPAHMGVIVFLEQILSQMQVGCPDINDLSSYIIKTRDL